MFSRKFSTREKILMLILVLLLIGELYYVLVQRRVEREFAEALSRTETATVTYELESVKAAKKQNMEDKIQEAEQDSSIRPLPDFDNSTNVVAYLNGVMASTDEYHLVFNAVDYSNYVAMRSINMSFSCWGYSTVENIVAQLEDGPYYCEVIGLSMSAEHGISDMTGQGITVPADGAEDVEDVEDASEEDPAEEDDVRESATRESVSVQMTAVFYEYAGSGRK